eukprot:TRINITY_DN1036_c0_g1_i1.p2 TRINITY_DN1036_c0_g1~~TRINITY_DN1036_c0_g1_i1.p2  ORF type:complete len:157 (+),score=35.63 TRINITY_DN1036_c0_g1_i1:782-1252(+)
MAAENEELQELQSDFHTSANALTRVYVNGNKIIKRAHRRGKQEALAEVQRFLQDHTPPNGYIRAELVAAYLNHLSSRLKQQEEQEPASAATATSNAMAALLPFAIANSERKRSLEDDAMDDETIVPKRARVSPSQFEFPFAFALAGATLSGNAAEH